MNHLPSRCFFFSGTILGMSFARVLKGTKRVNEHLCFQSTYSISIVQKNEQNKIYTVAKNSYSQTIPMLIHTIVLAQLDVPYDWRPFLAKECAQYWLTA